MNVKNIVKSARKWKRYLINSLFLIISLHLIIGTTQSPSISIENFAVVQSGRTDNETPQVLPTDIIMRHERAYNIFVLPEYKLIFFAFPKVACTEWKRMFMRMNNTTGWCSVKSPHPLNVNKIRTIAEYEPEIATEMMTSQSWTRAAIVREPKERVLSAFFNKIVNRRERIVYVKRCCNRLEDPKETEKCAKGRDGRDNFSSFLYFVSTYPNECSDDHWKPQASMIDKKWWPYINFIGHQDNLVNDAKTLLKSLKSSRDPVTDRSAWERYGVTGWGVTNDGCENRTGSFMEVNAAGHRTDAVSKMKDWYTAETEILVEKLMAQEWEQPGLNLPKVKLF